MSGNILMETPKEQTEERERISTDGFHHDTYKDLTSRSDEDMPPFESMKNLFMLAMFIGYKDGERKPLENKVGIFNWQQVKTHEKSLIYALAVTVTGGVEVLADRNKILDIAEEYANGGIIQIEEKIKEMPGDKIDNLLDLLATWLPNELTDNQINNSEY